MLRRFCPDYTLFTLAGCFAFTLLFSSCEKALNLKEPATDAVAVFDEVWTKLDVQYVFFNLKNVNWDSVYTVYRPQVTEDMSNDALFTVLDHMMQSLRDGHVGIITPEKSSAYGGFYQLYLKNFNYENIITGYLYNDYQTAGPIIYKVNEGIGYLYYSSFEMDVTDAEIDSVLTYFKDTKGLIIDVRDNSGGNTENANKLFRRFISARVLVKYEQQKEGKGHDDFFSPTAFYLSQEGVYYNKPICLLTNRSCFSACNDFVMYMSQLPNVTRIGDNTGGGGGIPVSYLLANGWKIQYTATATLTPQKEYIENGIVPDIHIDITPVEESNGKDPILDEAIQVLQ